MSLLAFLTPLAIATLCVLAIIIFGRKLPEMGRSLMARKLPGAGRSGNTWMRSKSTPRMTLDAFLLAFSRLDLNAILDCFHPQATAFFPAEHARPRLEGVGAIGQAFTAVIDKLKAAGKNGLSLDAEDVAIEDWGDAACVTFHLRGDHLSRRTLVMRRRAARWRIVHMHASNASFDE